MDIKTYLKVRELRQKDLADLLGVSTALVQQWASGYTPVSAERAVQMEHATKGAIKRSELRPDLWD